MESKVIGFMFFRGWNFNSAGFDFPQLRLGLTVTVLKVEKPVVA